jgi:hypothetical protein
MHFDCQKETKNENIFICKNIEKQFNYNQFKVSSLQCNLCRKGQTNVYNNFCLQVLYKKELDNYLIQVRKFICKNYTNSDYKKNINKLLKLNIYLIFIQPEGVIRRHQIEYDYFVENIKSLSLIDINLFINDRDNIFKYFRDSFLDLIKDHQKSVELSLKQHLILLKINKKHVIRLVEENKDLFSINFLNDIPNILKEYDKNYQKYLEDESFKPVLKVSLKDKIKGAFGAFERIKKTYQDKGKNALWIDERTIIERQVCCSMCTEGRTCPYCGCQIKKSWFLPLGKSELSTEGCPNPKTYPHLKRFPPKNYWRVCEQMSSIIIMSEDYNSAQIKEIVEKLLKNATGKIEILIGGEWDIPLNFKDIEEVVCFKEINKREDIVSLTKGEYVFYIDLCDYNDFGYDTKLKWRYLG